MASPGDPAAALPRPRVVVGLRIPDRVAGVGTMSKPETPGLRRCPEFGGYAFHREDCRTRPLLMAEDRPAATCSRCGHEKAEHGNDVLPFAPCQHLEGRPAVTRLFPFAYATESCWCSNYEEAEVAAA